MRIDFHAILPELVLAGTALLVLVVDLFVERAKVVANYLALAGTIAAGVALASLAPGGTRTTFGGSFVVDDYALLFKALFLGSLLLVLLMSNRYINAGTYYQGEFYFLILSSFVGMLLMPSSRDLLMLFLSLEIVSATGFIAAGFRKGDARSNEGALKFLLIGVLSTAVMLFGMSLVYGFTGSLKLSEIATRLDQVGGEPAMVMAVFLVITGFAFKVSAAPFHFWAPDTYEGSPVPVAAYLSVASKAAGFAGLLQVTFVAFPGYARYWAPAFAVLAALTMLIGNVIALAQTNMVRLLAYSSVAQAGYMLVPFAVGSAPNADRNRAFQAVLVYLLYYGVTNLGAFAVVTLISQRQPANLLSDYDGLGRRSASLGIAMTLFLLSLAGWPPFAGWYAKFVVFQAALSAGQTSVTILAVFMAVMTVVAFFYYLSICGRIWFAQPPQDAPAGAPAASPLTGLAIGLATAGVVVLGILPGLLVQYAPTASLVAIGR
ncbi:MAG TPA: NADH-quinone oxidoreductase subunit N [Actinomycetota bacterium]|nr:NADH-quinone oxidoreductase subunit N [Actinomycetota bacterium]